MSQAYRIYNHPKKYYVVYRVTNLVNGYIYIGAHGTNDLDDGYMGSGHLIRAAINSHGINCFKKENMYIFDSPQEMVAKERELVNHEFIRLPNVYNLKVAGLSSGCKEALEKRKLKADKLQKRLLKKMAKYEQDDKIKEETRLWG